MALVPPKLRTIIRHENRILWRQKYCCFFLLYSIVKATVDKPPSLRYLLIKVDLIDSAVNF